MQTGDANALETLRSHSDVNQNYVRVWGVFLSSQRVYTSARGAKRVDKAIHTINYRTTNCYPLEPVVLSTRVLTPKLPTASFQWQKNSRCTVRALQYTFGGGTGAI